ncbi:bifunctional molybdopterin-guanine dinucleotide biosynthesis adaptor protein MobB/molybdopterin molybdotransferase MoeA [Falsihalocynthiibacter sp. SS001]|uniref:bifunctional molybdopterin-guanine dinucleotide biosynthesis adaptor protein MobB/molybdopterin molybdotransferase MoeA n=1 Tax=Falsihalocynthiibacter sp. SS001 TaxID=3349698 RepID=UPI0036D3CB51
MKVFGVTGWKNNGKTGLMERLIAEVRARGFSVSTIKHAHHRFDLDQEGKDSFRHRAAGAKQVLLSSSKRWALMDELQGDNEPELAEHIARLDPVDLVLVEGFKAASHPKIEVHRGNAAREPLIALKDQTVLAVASDRPQELHVPVFDLDDTAAIADFILEYVGLVKSEKSTKAAPLKDDCFALPEGMYWTPVDEALAKLRDTLAPVVDIEVCGLEEALGKIVAADQRAIRSNPPAPNSAVDGYGIQNSGAAGPQSYQLLEGRSAAGAPFAGAVAAGQAVRVLTGAVLPAGVDSVVMQEDVVIEGGTLTFSGPLKMRANTRRAGEDVDAGGIILTKGTRICAPEIAILAATGAHELEVFKPLRVGVLSTGDELIAAGSEATPSQTYDANRPMLLSLAASWGHEAVDLGQAPDDPEAIEAALIAAATKVDVIFTSGGASGGDEDHVGTLLAAKGNLQTWRVAIKPGRPLAMAMWRGVPVFGLPGNPVAAFVCALVFARPSLGMLAGAGWQEPQSFMVPAGFSKKKKAGRREFLRARMTPEGEVEAFASEGSGRISGLSWANGLIDLSEDTTEITKGDLVCFLPFSSFGI